MVEHERDGELDQRHAGVLGEPCERLGGVELALVGRVGHVEPVLRARRGGRALDVGVFAVATRQPAACERAVGDDAHPVGLTDGQHVVLNPAGEDRVRRLFAAEREVAAVACGPLRLDDL
jgi:hypothetical protein